jgi:hypothetical protein
MKDSHNSEVYQNKSLEEDKSSEHAENMSRIGRNKGGLHKLIKDGTKLTNVARAYLSIDSSITQHIKKRNTQVEPSSSQEIKIAHLQLKSKYSMEEDCNTVKTKTEKIGNSVSLRG